MNHKTTWLVLCLTFMMVTLTGCSSSPPGDDVLVEKFISNRSDFHKLVEMMHKDVENTAIHKVDKNYTMYNSDQEGEIDEERFQEYQNLLGKLDLLSIAESTGDEESYIIVAYVKGWSPEGGVYKGYKYFRNGFPERLKSSLVESLEYDPQTYEPGTLLYRKIDENWYLWLIY